MYLTIKDLSKLISLYIKIIHRFQVYRPTLWEKAILEKNELSWTSVPASHCTFQTRKSEMCPTFQNIDCFKDETSSLMLPTHENIKQEQQQQICGRKGGRGSSARVANWNLTGWCRSGLVVGNKRTHPIRTLSRNNNTTTGLKRGRPNPLSGVLIPRPWEVVILSLLSMSPSSPQATERS